MTAFIRLLDVDVDEKGDVLRRLTRTLSPDRVVILDPETFRTVPSSPFSYWVSQRVRSLFKTLPPFENEHDGRFVLGGLKTQYDERFVRVWWELERPGRTGGWPTFAKGGSASPFYADLACCVNWKASGEDISDYAYQRRPREGFGAANRGLHAYFRPGITWPLRAARFAPQALPGDSIFSVRSYCAFALIEELRANLAILNSATFDYVYKTALGRFGYPEFIAGTLQRLPWVSPRREDATWLGKLAHRAWSLKRSLDTVNEISHAFVLPPGINEKVTGLDPAAVERELDAIQRQIDDAAYLLYGIGEEDRAAIEATAKTRRSEDGHEGEFGEEAEDDEEAIDALSDGFASGRLSGSLSWLFGVAFGRFDPRLATGERPIPPDPEPFDPLPSRSPGMYPKGQGPSDRPDILVDDEGHADDVVARAQSFAERVKVDVPQNLRGWLAKDFFPLHIKMYSKSRRKAPIYWQVATPSVGYSVWLYIHAFSRDTLFRVQNDYVVPKLAHEERRLHSLTRELRDGATASQRKQLAVQEALVEELRAFLDEVKRVAPLWKPNLDDGVVINFAPLWRLVPQNKAWQKELKSTWDALCGGTNDWAHLAMHLWPERVVPKCAADRSLAIAHGLEDVFWVEDTGGKWTARTTPTRSMDDLVRERTSPAVKSALMSLLEAPVAIGKSSGHKGGGRRKAAAVAEGGDA